MLRSIFFSSLDIRFNITAQRCVGCDITSAISSELKFFFSLDFRFDIATTMTEKEDDKSGNKILNYVITGVKLIGILTCLYFFVCSLDILSISFKLLAGKATGTIQL